MIAQLKNQDPTSPMETSEYTSQLAAFSQVEQSVSTNAKLDSLLSATNLQNAEARRRPDPVPIPTAPIRPVKWRP